MVSVYVCVSTVYRKVTIYVCATIVVIKGIVEGEVQDERELTFGRQLCHL